MVKYGENQLPAYMKKLYKFFSSNLEQISFNADEYLLIIWINGLIVLNRYVFRS